MSTGIVQGKPTGPQTQVYCPSLLSVNVDCYALFPIQEPLRVSPAPVAAVLTILSPTSSPWGALPSPWPHLWSSLATPCIMAVKTKTSQRPPMPPHEKNPPSPPQPRLITNCSQNQYTKTSSVLEIPFCSTPSFCSVESSLDEPLKTLVSVQTLVFPKAEAFLFPLPHWDCIIWDAQQFIIWPPWVSTLLRYVFQSLHLPYFLFIAHYLDVMTLRVFVFPQESACCQIPTSVRSRGSPHFLTSDAEAFHLCSRTLLSWSSSLRLYRCHLRFSYWIQPCSLHTSPETELCRMKQPPQIIKQMASCLLLLMQFGFRRRRMDHKLKPSTTLGTQRSRNIFFVFCCFVFFVAWTGWPSEFCLEALVLLYHLPCWVMITERLSVCYKLLFVDIPSLLKWWHSPIQTGYLSINVVQRLIQTNPQYVHSVARTCSQH